MAERPTLPDSTERKLAVLWDTLRDKLKLTEQDLANYDRERQRLLTARVNPMSSVHPLHFQAVAHHVGLDPSIKSAERRFRSKESEYWLNWCSSGKPYEEYVAWLESLRRDTLAELESVWKGRSVASDRWFEASCKPTIERVLSIIIKGRIAQARDIEVDRLSRLPSFDLERDPEYQRRIREGQAILDRQRAAALQGEAAGELREPLQVMPPEAKPDEPAGNSAGPAPNATKADGADRRPAVDAYIEEVFNRTGKRITRTDIWRSARYKSRTEFERWERNDADHPNRAAHERFARILVEKPHLK